MSEDITKAVSIPAPTKKDYRGNQVPGDWTVAAVEDAMWQFRAAGADDATVVKFDVPPWWTRVPSKVWWALPVIIVASAFVLPVGVFAATFLWRWAV